MTQYSTRRLSQHLICTCTWEFSARILHLLDIISDKELSGTRQLTFDDYCEWDDDNPGADVDLWFILDNQMASFPALDRLHVVLTWTFARSFGKGGGDHGYIADSHCEFSMRCFVKSVVTPLHRENTKRRPFPSFRI
jgi:hypothetical protein